MFELSVIKKYLYPSKKKLSVSFIAFLSMGLISLVVLIQTLFLSITDGIEKTWVGKLTAINGCIRIVPSKAYYATYFAKVDQFSEDSGYTFLSLKEKYLSQSDPYNPDSDPELPYSIERPIVDKNGKVRHLLKDLVRGIDSEVENLSKKRVIHHPGFDFYDCTGVMMKIKTHQNQKVFASSNTISQVSYLTSYIPDNKAFLAIASDKIQDSKQDLPMKGRFFPLLLPEVMKKSGLNADDTGELSFGAFNATSVSEQKIPFYVAGFYNTGLLAVGSRYLIGNHELVTMIAKANQTQSIDPSLTAGLQIWFDNPSKTTPVVAKALNKMLKKEGLSPYFNVYPYYDFPFAKELMQQFLSDKLLFSLVGFIIMIVASFNIVSVLLLLIHDKKREIGLYRALGATRMSIVRIFAVSGFLIAVVSSVIGLGLAMLVLRNLESITSLLTVLQNHPALSTKLYGGHLPSSISTYAIFLALVLGPALGAVAGALASLKALWVQPIDILRE